MLRPVPLKLKKKDFKINYQELLHPDLYGSLPSASRPELPVLKAIKTESIAPIRLMPFHEAYAHKDYGCVVHFFIRDHHFLCVLRHPYKHSCIGYREPHYISDKHFQKLPKPSHYPSPYMREPPASTSLSKDSPFHHIYSTYVIDLLCMQ